MVRLCLTRRELDSLICVLNRSAMLAEREGRFAEAGKLALHAAVLRDVPR